MSISLSFTLKHSGTAGVPASYLCNSGNSINRVHAKRIRHWFFFRYYWNGWSGVDLNNSIINIGVINTINRMRNRNSVALLFRGYSFLNNVGTSLSFSAQVVFPAVLRRAGLFAKTTIHHPVIFHQPHPSVAESHPLPDARSVSTN